MTHSILNTMMPAELQLRPDAILAHLSDLKDPLTQQGLVESQRLTDIIIAGNRINITLSVAPGELTTYESLRLDIERRVKAMPEALDAKVFVVMTTHTPSDSKPSEDPVFRGQFPLTEIKHVIAVASGKGGVGKSTTTVNLAYALRDLGLRVGILDADIYGPSIPKMLSIQGKPDSDDNNHMIPLEKDDIQIMSMGFLVEEETPIIWRGPIVQKAIQQFLSQVRWFNLDVLLVDFPPGTGDIQLTLVQKAHISGAIIVSTPQDVALIDARKAVGLFEKVEVPILGVIENMSYFICPHCQGQSDVFSHGGAHKTADALGVPFLAEVPLALRIREMTDSGQQQALVKHIETGFPYRQAATSLVNQLGEQDQQRGSKDPTQRWS